MYLLDPITVFTSYSVLLILYLYWLFHILDCTGFMVIKMMMMVMTSYWKSDSKLSTKLPISQGHVRHFSMSVDTMKWNSFMCTSRCMTNDRTLIITNILRFISCSSSKQQQLINWRGGGGSRENFTNFQMISAGINTDNSGYDIL
jgi:hypothetical protein